MCYNKFVNSLWISRRILQKAANNTYRYQKQIPKSTQLYLYNKIKRVYNESTLAKKNRKDIKNEQTIQ